jgi:hypothetical protein
MKRGRISWVLLFSVLVLSACEDKKDDFSGLSNLVEQRNQVRQRLSDKNAREKAVEQQRSDAGSKEGAVFDKEKKNPGVSPVILYERDVEVVDSSNRKSLAKGIAYLNKEGQIVKITIIKE